MDPKPFTVFVSSIGVPRSITIVSPARKPEDDATWITVEPFGANAVDFVTVVVRRVGGFVGDPVGVFVGLRVGVPVGGAVGFCVGVPVGWWVGEGLGLDVLVSQARHALGQAVETAWMSHRERMVSSMDLHDAWSVRPGHAGMG